MPVKKSMPHMNSADWFSCDSRAGQGDHDDVLKRWRSHAWSRLKLRRRSHRDRDRYCTTPASHRRRAWGKLQHRPRCNAATPVSGHGAICGGPPLNVVVGSRWRRMFRRADQRSRNLIVRPRFPVRIAAVHASPRAARRRRARPDTRTAWRASAARKAVSPAHRCTARRARVSAV